MCAMKVLSNLAGSYLTNDAVADAAVAYSDALAITDEVDLLEIPVIDEGRARLAPMVVGSLARLSARPYPQSFAVSGEAQADLHRLATGWAVPPL